MIFLMNATSERSLSLELQYRLGHREISQIGHRENKVYTLVLSQPLVFIAVAMNTDGFFSYQCIRFISSMIELQIFSMSEPIPYMCYTILYLWLYNVILMVIA